MKKYLKFLMVFIVASMLGLHFLGCESEELIDEPDILSTVDNVDETVQYAEMSNEVEAELFTIAMENNVILKHSDDAKIVFDALGTGFWRGRTRVVSHDTKTVDLANGSCFGEGVIDVAETGKLHYSVSSNSYPLPDQAFLGDINMRFKITGGTGEFADAAGIGTYNVTFNSETFYKQSVLIEGILKTPIESGTQ
jgi:hypothetical protein